MQKDKKIVYLRSSMINNPQIISKAWVNTNYSAPNCQYQ